MLDIPGRRATAASAEHLLGIKLLAARPEQDRGDTAQLAGILGLTTADEGLTVVMSLYPPEMLLPRTRFLMEEMFAPASPTAEVGPQASGPPRPPSLRSSRRR